MDARLSEEYVVIARKVILQDEMTDTVVVEAEVGDGPSYRISGESLLDAIGQLATRAAADAAQDEAMAWEARPDSAAAERARVRRELLALIEASPAGPPHLYLGDVDRICPAEERPERRKEG